jgi:hypothetical protein
VSVKEGVDLRLFNSVWTAGSEAKNFKSQISNHRFHITDFISQISYHRFHITDFISQISNHRLQITDFKSQISNNLQSEIWDLQSEI